MTELSALQCAKRMRVGQPKFMACIVSHEGEMSPDVFGLIEQMAKRVKKQVSTDFISGYPPEQVSAEFRRRAKDRIATVVASGIGRAFCSVGLPTPATVALRR